MNTLILDFGNSHIKARVNGAFISPIRSCVKVFKDSDKVSKGNESNPVIGYAEKYYQYGEAARDFYGYENLVHRDKENNLIPGIFAAINPIKLTGEGTKQIDLTLLNPDAEAHETDLVAMFKGKTFEYSYNGIECSIEITSVTVEEEGYRSYQKANLLGLVPDTGYTLISDIGGGTWNIKVYNNTAGTLYKLQSYKKAGAIKLGELLADSPEIRKVLGTVDAGLILDAIKDGTYTLTGYNSDKEVRVNFSKQFKEVVREWSNAPIKRIYNDLRDIFPRINLFLFTGGGAHFVLSLIAEKNKTKGSSAKWIVLDNPETSNLYQTGDIIPQNNCLENNPALSL